MPAAPSADWEAFTRRVGAALAHHRRLKGLSQQQVGEAIGVEPETVSRMETGVISPSLKRLCQLALVLDCPVEQLMGAASHQPQSLLNRLGEQLADLNDEDRGFVIRQSLALATWLADRDRARLQRPDPLQRRPEAAPSGRRAPQQPAQDPWDGPGL